MDYVESKRANIKEGIAPRTNLEAEYHLDNTGADTSGNSRTATLANCTAVKDRFNRANKAESFNGSTSYATLPTTILPSNLATSDWTVAMWVKPASVPASQGFLFDGLSNVPYYTGFWIRYTSSKTYQIIFGDGVGGTTTLTSNNTYEPGQWVLIIAGKNGTKGFILIQGSDYTEGSPTFTTASNYVYGLGRYLYSSGSASYFNGAMSDVKTWNRALTSYEKRALIYNKQ